MKTKSKIDSKVLSELISKGFEKHEAELLDSLRLNISQTVSNLRSFALSWSFALKRNPDDFSLSSRAIQSIKEDYDSLLHSLSEFATIQNAPLLRELKSLYHEIGVDL